LELIKHHHANQNKQKNKRNKYQKPGNHGGIGLTNEIQNPGPKENINEFQQKDECGTGNITRLGS
jgi:hypothetical protein